MRCSKQEKALCILADQSTMQRATNHHREAGTVIVLPPAQKNKEENENEVCERNRSRLYSICGAFEGGQGKCVTYSIQAEQTALPSQDLLIQA